MTEEDMKAYLAEHSERIKEAAVTAIISRITESIRYGLPDTVQKVVNDFMKDEVAPAVALALQSEKNGIIAAASKGAAEIGDALAKVMVENAVKNMTGYRGGEILKKLLD